MNSTKNTQRDRGDFGFLLFLSKSIGTLSERSPSSFSFQEMKKKEKQKNKSIGPIVTHAKSEKSFEHVVHYGFHDFPRHLSPLLRLFTHVSLNKQ